MRGRRIIGRAILVAACAVAALYFGLSGEGGAEELGSGSSGGWLPAYGDNISKDTFFALRNTGADLFKSLTKKDAKVSNAMDKLYATSYPLEKKRRAKLTKSIKDLIDFRGRPVAYDFIGLQALQNTRRFYVMTFLTFHGENKVTAWKIDFVKVKAEWKIRNIRFDSWSPYEFLAGSGADN